jgi:hypothetical protein
VEQGVLLCSVVSIGGLIRPLIAGAPAPPDVGEEGDEECTRPVHGFVFDCVNKCVSDWPKRPYSSQLQPMLSVREA